MAADSTMYENSLLEGILLEMGKPQRVFYIMSLFRLVTHDSLPGINVQAELIGETYSPQQR